jgi:hypothetical protein
MLELVAAKMQAQRLQGKVDRYSTTLADPPEALSRKIRSQPAALRAYIDFGLADPTRYRVAFMTKLAPHIDASSFLDQGAQARKGADTLRQLVSAVLRNPEPQAVEATMQALWKLVHGVVALLVEHPRFPWVARDRLIARSLELVISGIGPGPRRPPAGPSRPGARRAAEENGASRAREGGAE